ncbi:MAG: DNA-3-methyladenine glycosylase I [Spirochaetia bacterium]|nr:DNA-3-methyladenine glycosylase I [Spirochaetia bacterium]
MPEFTSYCAYCASLPLGDLHRTYHDSGYGFPITDDRSLFCRLVLEINQAGLSWSTILKKQDNFIRAYDGFDIDTVAAYGETDRQRLLADAGIIRNRLKVNAAIENARALQGILRSHGSFHQWLAAHHPLDKPGWLKLFRQHFVFVGGEIVGEFLMSTGWLPGAHVPGCPAGDRAAATGAPWAKSATGHESGTELEPEETEPGMGTEPV